MKKMVLFFFIFTTLNLTADSWTQKASVGTRYLRGTTSFSIGTKGYVCCGFDTLGNFTNALWEYDQISNVWTQKANYGGGGGILGSSFAIQGKGYVGLGEPASKEWWEYDPTTNTWTRKSDFGGGKRFYALSFSSNNKGYVFGGYNDSTTQMENDLWEYEPFTDIWTRKTSCPCLGRESGIAFSIGNKGYIGGGVDTSYTHPYPNDFWEYNPVTDGWTQKDSIPASLFIDNGYFSIGNYGYVTCGEMGPPWTTFLTTLWQYNSLLDQWIAKASFPGASRDEVASFSIGNYGYVGWGGKNGVPQYNDFYQYAPDSADLAFAVNEIPNQQSTITISPNPFTSTTTITFSEEQRNTSIKVMDVLGQTIQQYTINNLQSTIDMSGYSKGIYFIEATTEKGVVRKKVVKD